jgi:hypothetical protein
VAGALPDLAVAIGDFPHSAPGLGWLAMVKLARNLMTVSFRECDTG